MVLFVTWGVRPTRSDGCAVPLRIIEAEELLLQDIWETKGPVLKRKLCGRTRILLQMHRRRRSVWLQCRRSDEPVWHVRKGKSVMSRILGIVLELQAYVKPPFAKAFPCSA
mmetsp:Transcript_25899/g.40546  ORF Transcript_25899/g.40546 Transcript_25899/m.40546 type:complete len:111 (-) Transcript_25899:389-721(-)